MTHPSQDEQKLGGAAFDDFFESLGKKAEHLTIDEKDGNNQVSTATNDTNAPATKEKPAEDDDDQKVVDEIESLCMNCRENVSFRNTSSCALLML